MPGFLQPGDHEAGKVEEGLRGVLKNLKEDYNSQHIFQFRERTRKVNIRYLPVPPLKTES
jgi:hypothetical protein